MFSMKMNKLETMGDNENLLKKIKVKMKDRKYYIVTSNMLEMVVPKQLQVRVHQRHL